MKRHAKPAQAVSARRVVQIATRLLVANDNKPRATIGEHIAEGCGDD